MGVDLNSEQWHRQLLRRDRELSVEETVEAVAGIYSTAPTSYLSFVARVPGFTRADLDRALYQDRTLVRRASLRGSGFLIPIGRIDAVASAPDRVEWYTGAVDKAVGADRRRKWTREILDVLDGRVLRAREIRAELGVSGDESEALRFLLTSLSQHRLITAASGASGWRDNQYGYALWDQWFPDHPVREIDPGESRAELARWYLGGHGPATVEDFAWWSGLKKGNAAVALAAVSEADGDGMYDLPGATPAPPPRGLRLLPVWDTALVTQKERRRTVDPAHYPYVYDASGNLTSTIVSDARVVGVWDRGGDNDRIEIKAAFFAGAGPNHLVESEAESLAAALGATEVTVEFVTDFADLTRASRNRFMSPLSGV
ncbi:MAG: winged helix DNA-binding domain-containing protein [Acidimicrobiia bacterium]